MLVCTVWYTAVCSSAVFVLFRMNSGPCLKMCSSAVFVMLGCRLTRGASRQTSALKRLRQIVGTRDLVWDLAAGAMPTGRNAMLPLSRRVCTGQPRLPSYLRGLSAPLFSLFEVFPPDSVLQVIFRTLARYILDVALEMFRQLLADYFDLLDSFLGRGR